MARRVTLVVAFSFLSQNFGRWQRPMNAILSLYDCSLSGGDTQRWWGHSNTTDCNQKIEPFALTGGRDTKISCSCPCAHLHPPLAHSFVRNAKFFKFLTMWTIGHLPRVPLFRCLAYVVSKGGCFVDLRSFYCELPRCASSYFCENTFRYSMCSVRIHFTEFHCKKQTA